MEREIWIAGFPSHYGGADTELDHQVDLWRSYGVDVHLVPMFGSDEPMISSVLDRGCHIHDYRDDIFADRVVVSYCNGPFLEHLPAIAAAGRPRCTVWFNCMTWLFDAEKEAHSRGLIDRFGFVSDYQKRMLLPQLESIAPVSVLGYRPHFSLERVDWHYRPWDGTYRVGRISRDDEAKFSSDTWRIFDRVLVPAHLKKKVYVLGFGPNAERRIGSAPAGMDWRTWSPNEISAAEFFLTVDTMIHKTGGSRESYGRVLVEAYAHGAVPIVERDYAFTDLVVHGETGFLTSDSDEMSYFASWLAMNPAEHRRIAENGREHLRQTISDPKACWQGWSDLLESLGGTRPRRGGRTNIASADAGTTSADAGTARHDRVSPCAESPSEAGCTSRRPRVLAFTCSRDRPILLRHCILQMRAQTYRVDHAVYVNGGEDTRSLYDDLASPGLFLRFGASSSQHENHLNAIAAARYDSYDLFCKVDDDDVYRLDYIESVVEDFEHCAWDYSGAHSDGVVKGRRWLPDTRLQSLGLLQADRELGVIDVMPATAAFSRRGMECVLAADSTGYEDVDWRRAIATAKLRQQARPMSRFVYHVHGHNVSTGHWLEAG